MSRREHVRYPAPVPVLVEFGQHVGADGVIEDLSIGGVRLSTTQPVAIDAEILVRAQIPNEPGERMLRGRVVRCQPREDTGRGIWRFFVAVAFDPKSRAESERVLGTAVVGTAVVNDRRRDPRHEIERTIRIVPEQGPEVLGVVRDLSQSGISVATTSGLFAGDRVLVLLPVPGVEGVERRYRGRIVRVTLLDHDRAGLWSDEIAVAFDAPIENLEELLDDER